ncbi:MAG TPA: hypothetical protein VGS21_06275 [Acidimicrobiales bacterium]|nr:hypothetical protein [Acidimicrobiales bacterium]
MHISGLHNWGISCVSGSTFCAALVQTALGVPGSYGVQVTTNGSTWTQHNIGNDGVSWDSIACGAVNVCLLSGGPSTAEDTDVMWTTDGGQTWGTPTELAVVIPGDLSCPSETTCYMGGYDDYKDAAAVMKTANEGASWQELSAPSSLGGFYNEIWSISCPAATTCVAGNGGGQALRTTDGGSMWSTSTIENAYSGKLALSCGTTKECVAAYPPTAGTPGSAHAYVSADGGATWSAGTTQIPQAGAYVDALDCVNASDCWMTTSGQQGSETSSVLASIDGGREWFQQNASDNYGGSFRSGVSCDSPSGCYFVGGSTLWSTTDGGGIPPSTTYVSVLPAEPVVGQVTYLVAFVDQSASTATAFGTATFSVGGSRISFCTGLPVGHPYSGGEVVCALYFTSDVGSVSVGVVYSGDALDGPSSASSSLGVHEPGYRMVAGDGGIFDYGTAFHGSLGGHPPTYPISDCASDYETSGYWMIAEGGAVHAFDAPHIGDVIDVPVGTDPIVGIAGTLDGGGYWLVGKLGDVYAFGDAENFGSVAYSAAHVVAIVPTENDGGYWIAYSNGYVAAKGNATNYGNLPALGVHVANVVGMAATPFSNGYWLVGSDGGIFTFGAAKFHGSMGGQHLNKPIVGMTNDPATDGYWLVASDGGIFTFDAKFLGSAGNLHLNSPILSMSVG